MLLSKQEEAFNRIEDQLPLCALIVFRQEAMRLYLQVLNMIIIIIIIIIIITVVVVIIT